MDKLIYNAKVYIEREKFAEAVLIQNETISLVGSNKEVFEAAMNESEYIDAKGCLLLPGFYDSHLHLAYFGRETDSIPAANVTSISELIERGRKTLEKLAPGPEAVITGMGWDQEEFVDEKRYPTRYDLDKISTEHGIIISRKCGHMVCCNTKALELAGIGYPVPIVDGGQIDVDNLGRPTGILREKAGDLVFKIVPAPTEEEIEKHLEYAMKHALKNGLVAVASQDVKGNDMDLLIRIYARIYEKGIRLRISQQAGIENESQLDEYIQKGYRTGTYLHAPYLKMGPLKLFADGSLGSRTALLREFYKDVSDGMPKSRGIRVLEPDIMAVYIKKASQNGLQVVVHAIGDGAIDTVVTNLEAVTKEYDNPLRHGVLHCQITDPPLLERMARNNILALVQPIFLASDLHIVEKRVGRELASTSYAFGTMERLKISTSYGSDCPVESLNPLACIAAAVTRRDISDNSTEAFYPEECVDVWTAVDNYTLGSAYANFDEDRLGRIRPGYLADLVLLDQDIFSIPPEQIGDAQVLFTMVGGEIMYKKTEAGQQLSY